MSKQHKQNERVKQKLFYFQTVYTLETFQKALGIMIGFEVK